MKWGREWPLISHRLFQLLMFFISPYHMSDSDQRSGIFSDPLAVLLKLSGIWQLAQDKFTLDD